MDCIGHSRLANRELFIALRIHEVPELTVLVQILKLGIDHVRSPYALAGLVRPFDDTAGLKVSKLDAVKCLPFPRFHKLVLEDRARIAVHEKFQSGLELICTVGCHTDAPLLSIKADHDSAKAEVF